MLTLPVLLGLFLAQQTPPAPAPSVQPPVKPPLEKVLAKVDGNPLTAGDIEPYLWDWKAREIVEELIVSRSVESAAAKGGVKATDEEVTAMVQKQLAQVASNGMTEAQLRQQGFPVSRIYLIVRTNLLVERLTLASFKPENYVKTSRLVYKPSGPALVNLGVAAKRAENAYNALKIGGKWEEVSKRNGVEATSGWQEATALPPMKDVSAGTLLAPRRTGEGFEITRVDTLGAGAPAAEMESLRQQYLASHRDGTMERIKREAKVERP